MIKYSRSNCQLRSTSGRNISSLALEKMSGDRCGQLDWAERTQSLDPRIADWVRNHDALDFDNFVYAVVCPLGADESWEETVNGDAFEEDEIQPKNDEFGHWTFTLHGKAYHHHKNNDPLRSYGDLPFMVYNDDSARCEGIWRLDRARMRDMNVPYVGERIERGEDVAISMGCRVPYDVCSICGNKAATPAEYCEHPTTPGFGAVLADGRKVRVFNPRPSFFDLSDVIVNAAPEAFVMGSILPELATFLKSLSKTSGVSAGRRIVLPSSLLASYNGAYASGQGLSKFSSAAVSLKLSDMIKIIPALSSRVIDPTMAVEADLTDTQLKRVQSACGHAHGALSNLAASGIVLKPGEFKRLLSLFSTDPLESGALLTAGLDEARVKRAFLRGEGGHQFIVEGAVSPQGLKACGRHAEDRSVLFPHFAIRVHGAINDKGKGQVRLEIGSNTDEVSRHLSGAYGTYLRQVAQKMGKMLEEAIARYPDLARTEVIAHPRVAADTKLSSLEAQAVLPAAYICKLANAMSPQVVTKVVQLLNTPGAAPYLGGVVA